MDLEIVKEITYISVLHIVAWDNISNELAEDFCGIKVQGAIGHMCSHHMTLILGYAFFISKIWFVLIFYYLIKQLCAEILLTFLLSISLIKPLERMDYPLVINYGYIFKSEHAMSFTSEEGRVQYKEDLRGIWLKWSCLHIPLPSETFEGLPNS